MPEQDIVVPNIAESVSEVTILSWHVQPGDFVEVDDPLCEIETDKANADVPAEAAGVIVSHAVQPGDTVQVGGVIGRIDTDQTQADAGDAAPAEASSEAKDEPAAAPASKPSDAPAATQPVSTDKLLDLSPAVRRIVSEKGLDPDAIPATGPNGRLTKEDVLAFADQQAQAKPAGSKPESKPETQPAAPPSKPPASPRTVIAAPGDGPQRRVPMGKMRKSIARNLLAAQQNAAILTTFNEVDLTEVMALRAKYKEPFGEKHGIGLGFMSFFTKAACVALGEFERVNARIDGEDIVYHDYVNMGIAVSTERGLNVPVIKNAHAMGFAQIEGEIKRLAAAARDGKIALGDMSGGTFTITNGGVFGSLLSTPILNAPQSGILGMHTIQQRPMAVGGEVKIRPMMYLALSYDHRIVDGKESVSFLVRLKQLLEDPARLLLDV